MGENRVVADQMGEVRAWATNCEHRSHKTKSRARLLRSKRYALRAAEAVVEAGLTGVEWLLTKRTLLTELGMCRVDLAVPIALRVVRTRHS